jgi:hypothetical protein
VRRVGEPAAAHAARQVADAVLDQHLDVGALDEVRLAGAVQSRSQYGACSRSCPYLDRYRLGGAMCELASMA